TLTAKVDVNVATRQEVDVAKEKYEITGGQQGAVGHGARAEHFTQQQVVTQQGADLDLPTLAAQLETLRLAMQKEAKETNHYTQLAAVAEAESGAKEGNASKV